MKCPYNNFEDCIVEKCPSCNYETIEETVIEGRCPNWMDYNTALKRGNIWESKKKKYKFISCNLADNCVQPVLRDEHINIDIDNTETNVFVKHSIF